MEGIQTFKGSWPWPWPWIRPYDIQSCITHRPLPIYQISFKSKKLFVDGRTDVRMDGHFSPSNIIRSTFGSRPNNNKQPLPHPPDGCYQLQLGARHIARRNSPISYGTLHMHGTHRVDMMTSVLQNMSNFRHFPLL